MSAPSLTIEQCRQYWADVAKKKGWYKEPFFVQVWVDTDGDITDSVSYRELDRDYILDEDDMPL